MRDLTSEDPAETVLAWEAVEELLAPVPASVGKDILRMVAGGLPRGEIADRLGLGAADVEVLVNRARVRVLTALVARPGPPGT